jgi:Fe-S-cluster containining protein
MAREEVEPTWNDYPCDGTWERAHERWRDVQKAADMLIPLGKHKRNPIHPQRQDDRDDIRVNFFTCKYFDGETRNCLDYEDRPRMCSSFPNSQSTCPYEGCKHFNAKERIVRRPFGAETKKAKKEKV